MFYDIGPLDVPETPSGTVGQTGHWDNLKVVGVLGMSLRLCYHSVGLGIVL